MKIYSIAALVLFCQVSLQAPVHAEEAYVTRYAASDTEGRVRWTAHADIVRAPGAGSDSYVLTERGRGVLSGFKGKVSWEARLEFESIPDRVRPVLMENKVFSESGVQIFEEREEFDHSAGKARYSGKDLLHNRTRKGEYAFKGDIANRMILGLYIQKFLEHGGKEASLALLSSEPRLYEVRLRVVGKEDIVINGVKKEAFKLCLDPELGILNFIKTVIPKAYVWHSAEPKFEWMRYRGLENSLGSPMVEITSGDIK